MENRKSRLNWLFLLVGVSILGDTALYAVLPVYAAELGIPLWWVGILLSANRLVRLVANPLAARLFESVGTAKVFSVALFVAAGTTLVYGLTTHLGLLLLARVLWGVCWSVMRLASFDAILRNAPSAERGSWMGRFRSSYRSGSLAAVLTGGLLADLSGYSVPFLIYGAAGLIAAFAGLFVVKELLQAEAVGEVRGADGRQDARPQVAPADRQSLPPVWGVLGLGLLVAWVAEGLLPSTLGYFVWLRFGDEVEILGLALGAATFTGFLLSFRYGADVLMAPAAGAIADRVGTREAGGAVLLLTALFITLLLFTAGAEAFAVVVILLLCLLAAAITVSEVIAAHAAQGAGRVRYMARYATAADLGSALGPLGGYILGVGIGIGVVYGAAAALMAGAAGGVRLLFRTKARRFESA